MAKNAQAQVDATATGDETTAATEAPGRKTRNSVAKKFYIVPGLADADQPQKVVAGSTAVRFDFANGVSRTVAPGDLPESIAALLTLYGIAQKLGDTYAGVSGDIDEAVEGFDAMLEQFKAGDWSTERAATGPLSSRVVEAWVNVQTAAGKSPTDEAKAAVAAILKDGGTWPATGETVTAAQAKAKFTANPKIAAEMERLRAERAAAKLAKLAEKPATTDAEIDF